MAFKQEANNDSLHEAYAEQKCMTVQFIRNAKYSVQPDPALHIYLYKSAVLLLSNKHSGHKQNCQI
jgi:hypothetical protein